MRSSPPVSWWSASCGRPKRSSARSRRPSPSHPVRQRRDDGAIATLLLINGPPGVGKSTLARRYVDDHELTLLLEVDEIRTSLGRWREAEASKLAARRLATAMAEAHLRDGHDVVVPQFLGRLPFIETLDAVAQRTGSDLREVVLVAGEGTIVERFRVRRAALATAGHAHPEADVEATEVAREITEALRSLDRLRARRPLTIAIDAARDPETTYRALLSALGEIPE